MKFFVLIISLVFVLNVVSSETIDSEKKCQSLAKCQRAANNTEMTWMSFVTGSEFNLLKKENAEMKKETADMKKENADMKKENSEIKGFLKRIRDVLVDSQAKKEALCYMGMKSRKIPDSAITASSEWPAASPRAHAASRGRLDMVYSKGVSEGAWAPSQNRVGEWMEVDLGQPKVVAGVVTQGRDTGAGMYSWVTSYKVSCGNTENTKKTITENGQEKVFSANTDSNTKVENKFPELMTCRYIRIYPQSYHYGMTMRLDIISGICMDVK